MGIIWFIQLVLNAVLTVSVVYLIWEKKKKAPETTLIPWEEKTSDLEFQFQQFRGRWEQELKKLRALTAKVTELLEKLQERRRIPTLEEKEFASLGSSKVREVQDFPSIQELSEPTESPNLKALLKEHLV